MFEEALVVGAGVLLLVAIVTLVLVIAARGSATGRARPVRRYTTRTDSVTLGSSEAMMAESFDHPDQDGGHHLQVGGHHSGGHHDGGGHYGGDGGGGHHGG